MALRALAVAVLAIMFSPVPAFAASRDGLFTASDKADYREAFRWAKRGNQIMATRHALRAKDPLLRKVIRWSEPSRQGNNLSFKEIVAFISANPEWPYLQQLERRAEQAIDENTPGKTSLRWLSSHPPVTGNGMSALGKALIADGRNEEGETFLRRAWIERTYNRRSSRLFLKQYGKFITKEVHWARLDNLL